MSDSSNKRAAIVEAIVVLAIAAVATIVFILFTPTPAKAAETVFPAPITFSSADITARMDVGPGGQHVALTKVQALCTDGALLAVLADGQGRIMAKGCYIVRRGEVQITWSDGDHDTLAENRFRETAAAPVQAPAVRAEIIEILKVTKKDAILAHKHDADIYTSFLDLECPHSPGRRIAVRVTGHEILGTGCYAPGAEGLSVIWDSGALENVAYKELTMVIRKQAPSNAGEEGDGA